MEIWCTPYLHAINLQLYSNQFDYLLQESDIEDATNKEEQQEDYLKSDPQPGTSDLCERLER